MYKMIKMNVKLNTLTNARGGKAYLANNSLEFL